jgi:biopolymer transport protein ExbD
MSASMSHDSSAEPNLTPILDMVFQLITFFMLVINFKSAQLDMSLKLPVVGSAKPVDTKGAQDLLVLNVDKEGDLVVYGLKRNVEEYISDEARASRLGAKRNGETIEAGGELPTIVVIRADMDTSFKLLNRVIQACQQNGFRNFALKAMDKAEA